MPITSRQIGYSGSALELQVAPVSASARIGAFLWGGGGGGGGSDSQPGGNGTGGGFCEASFNVNALERINLFIGQGGAGGIGRQGSAPGGSAGSGYVADQVFSTRNAAGTQGLIPNSLSYAWSNFMNTHSVWSSTNGAVTDFTVLVNFPVTGNYQFNLQCDNEGYVFVDGVQVLSSSDFASSAPNNRVYAVTEGIHSVRYRGINYHGPAGIAGTILIGNSFSGAFGGAAGPAGSSGGGGGGGGATVLLSNQQLVAVAGGGGGGGGGGRVGAGGSAPGPRGNATADYGYNGQNGQDHPGDGGGGGGGGGGFDGNFVGASAGGGGNGGYISLGDVGGEGGMYGLSWSSLNVTANPVGLVPGGVDNINWRAPAGFGGIGAGLAGNPSSNGQSGSNGFAVIYMNVPGVFVASETGEWIGTREVYIKQNNIWQKVNAIYVNQNGQWIEASGQNASRFYNIPGRFGKSPRAADAIVPPPSPTPSWDGGSGDSNWSGNQCDPADPGSNGVCGPP